MKNAIVNFYKAFENLDAEKMIEYYHKDIKFEDPAFGILEAEKAKNMWRMLCRSQKGQNFNVKASKIEYGNSKGSAHWEAHYVFSKTGRKVHNIINAEFEFEDGKIIKHTDRFDLYKWAKQALGLKGALLGWTAFFRKRLISQTNKMLSEFEQKINITSNEK